MSWLRNIIARSTGSSDAEFEGRLDDELQFHVDRQAEENIKCGMDRATARREALRQLGGVEQVRENVRDACRIVWLSDLFRDTKFSLRMLARSPAFAVTAVVVLGVAIGLSTTIFSFVRAILIEPLPFANSDRLVVIGTFNSNREHPLTGASWPDIVDWKKSAKSFSDMAAFKNGDMDLSDGKSTQRIRGLFVTRNFFELLGIPFELGRSFSESEESDSANALILSRELWKSRYQHKLDIVGNSVDVYSWIIRPEHGLSRWQIVGIAEQEIPFLPVAVDALGDRFGINDQVQFWRPIGLYDEAERKERWEYTAIARLNPGVTIEQARAEMATISSHLADEYPEANNNWSAKVTPLNELVTSDIRPALQLLSGAVAFLLLIACANVASLLIVRGIARQQEFAVRIAVGAGRWRLIRQLITESVLLCLAGGALGSLLSVWCIDAVRLFAPTKVPRLGEVSVDSTVLMFALGLSLMTGLFVGILPACLAFRTDVNDTLKSGGRGSSAARSRKRWMAILVGGEVAVCLVLLTGSGLLIQSFAAIIGVDPGFRTDNLMTMTVSLPQGKYEWKHNTEFCVELTSKLRTVPGIAAASAVRGVPTRETNFDAPVFIDGAPEIPRDERPDVRLRVVEPGFFEVMEVPLLEGRLFEPADSIGNIGHAPQIICNETMARRHWPGESAIGKKFCVVEADYDKMEVVGVVGDVQFGALVDEARPEIYYPEALFPQSEFTLLVRTEVPPEQMMATVETLVREAEPDVVITDTESMDTVLSKSLSKERFLVLLLSAFSLGAFLLSVTGHYGVVAYAVSQRRQEIGIRMALGATVASIVRMIVSEGLLISGMGLLVGLCLSLALSQFLQSQLFGISAADPLTLAIAAGVLLLATSLASLIPSIRGARISPASTLRSS
jgi:putative ABC transport system permease protein